MRDENVLAKTFRMTDEHWQRHANPWSVWTRFAAIPAGIVALWSRIWIGWWALVPLCLVAVWLWLNVLVFPPITEPNSWAAKGIYGEKLWLELRPAEAQELYSIQRRLIILSVLGMLLFIWGVIRLHIWATLFGATVLVLAQLWRIDCFSTFYDRQSLPASARPD